MDLEVFSLKGKTALVTGCARGIGLGIAQGLAQAGADIVGMDIADLGAAQKAVTGQGQRFFGLCCDLADADAIDEAWQKAVSCTGQLDILVNNAGMQHRESAYTYPTEILDKVLAVNLRSQYLLAQKAANLFRRQGRGGRIINIASLFSTFGGMQVSGYTLSKHGVVGLTRALSNEFAADGIRVNAIAPGYIATELTQSIWQDAEKSRPINERIPAGRWGRPQDLAGAAVFLASEASGYITGAVIPVDGGYTCR